MLTIQKENPELLASLQKEWASAAAAPMRCVEILRAGMPWETLQTLARALGFAEGTMAEVLRIPPRTLARRKGRKLELNEGERVLRLIRLSSKAIDVLGDSRKAAHWLTAPNGALEGATPISLVDTDIGTLEAEAVLGRIEYGVYS